MRFIALFSGGLDSALMCAYLRNRGEHLLPLFIQRGQRNLDAEQQAATSIARALNLEPLLTASLLMPWPSVARPRATQSQGLPARNLALISIAAYYAGLLDSDAIAIGNVADDDFPDCTRAFRLLASQVVTQGLGRPVTVVAPLADWEYWDKAHTLQWAKSARLEEIVSLSWSCWKSSEAHCGVCAACSDRRRAFQDAALPDPTKYAT